jgi:hypothetical protein
MSQEIKKPTYLSISLIVLFLLICSPLSLRCEKGGEGNIIGFVYDKDGTTPLDGAIVKFLNVATDAVYESSETDSNGLFKVVGVANGIYIFGVLTPRGDFVLDDLIGVKIQEHETAKLSISLMPAEEVALFEQKANKKVEKNNKTEWVMPESKLDQSEQAEILTEEEMALEGFKGIAAVNAASSGISFGILTSDPEKTMEITCCSPSDTNFGDFVDKIRRWWRRWWSHCGRGK